VGIVRVSGALVPRIAEGIIKWPLAPRVATISPFVDAAGEILDQGLALYFPAPHSYTGESVLELHGHGGPAVLRSILARCVELGARLAQPGEFTQRAFLNGKLDLAQAESVADLIDAATTTAARAAARSLTGAFSSEIRALGDALIDLRMLVEATLDFPEEDVDFLHAADATRKLAQMRAQVAEILTRARQGALLRDGIAVVLVGRPNVGKSSLLNQLAGDAVAIVTPIAGTTRDSVRSDIEIRGIPITVIDTAGLRPTDDVIEKMGIERTWQAIRQADIALVIVEAGTEDESTEEDLLSSLPDTLTRIVVHNKIDLVGLVPRVEMHATSQGNDRAPRAERHVFLSAKTGVGVDLLQKEMLNVAGAHEEVERTFLARERHLVALREASRALETAGEHIAMERPALELLAEDLRGAQNALGSITGEFTADDLLGVIFSRFCIGK
jgi:tRNA modification GTPase